VGLLRRPPLLTLAIVSALVGVGAKLYSGPGAHWSGAYGAGILYVLFWISVVLWIWPGLSPWRVAAGVLAVTCALEALQLWHPPILTLIRATWLGRTLIGTTFSWWDFPHYAAGCALGILIARGLPGREA